MFRAGAKTLVGSGNLKHIYLELALTCIDAEELGKPFLLKGNFISALKLNRKKITDLPYLPFCEMLPETEKKFLGFTSYNWSTGQHPVYRKNLKNSDIWKIGCNHPKIWTTRFYHTVMLPKDANAIANSVDPDQTAPRSSLIWVCTVCQGLSVRKLMIITVCENCQIVWQNWQVFVLSESGLFTVKTASYSTFVWPVLKNTSLGLRIVIWVAIWYQGYH